MNTIPSIKTHHIRARYLGNISWPIEPLEMEEPDPSSYLSYTGGQLVWTSDIPHSVIGVQGDTEDSYSVLEVADHVFPGQSVGMILTADDPDMIFSMTEAEVYEGTIDLRTEYSEDMDDEDIIYCTLAGKNTHSLSLSSSAYGEDNVVGYSSWGSSILGGYDNNVEIFGDGSCILGGTHNAITIQTIDYPIVGTVSGENNTCNYIGETSCGRWNNFVTTNGFRYRIFSVGVGTADDDRRNAFSVDVEGTCYGQHNEGDDADYAEMYESKLLVKIPVGTTITFELDVNSPVRRRYIRPCRPDEVPVGVISNTAGIILNNARRHWHGKYITTNVTVDDIVPVTRPVEHTIKVDIYDSEIDRWFEEEQTTIRQVPVFEEDGETPLVHKIGTKIAKQRTINPEWDESRTYIPREDRPEWNVVGLLGKCKVLHLQPINPDWILLEEHSNHDIYLVR